MALGLFNMIKKIPSLKDLGGDTLHNKSLAEIGGTTQKKQGMLGNIPQISQAMKLKAYISSCMRNDLLQNEFETEFEGLVQYII